jgi:myo-inositol-1(or 4)-monophosphatase
LPVRESDLVADLTLLEEAVREAGHIARRFFGGPFKRWSKDKGSPVTEADLAIDEFLTNRLRSARRDYGWLSEETEDDASRLNSACTFVVDPIDGTIAFVRGKPHFTICAGVISEGRPIAGVVYNPITEDCFRAARGLGAACNGEPIRVSGGENIEGCRMLGDKAMFEHPAWSSLPNIPWPPMQIDTRNSIALRMALVARGEFDAMLALSAKHDWDLAAAEIIVLEAGGVVTAHTGDVLKYNGATAIQPSVIAAGPALHANLLARVRHLKLPG